jgi:cytochrome c-type biogenesis protein CcmF
MAWKRANLTGVVQRLWAAALVAILCGAAAMAFINPRKVMAPLGLMLGAWLILGALSEVVARVRLGAVPLAEVGRRLKGLPRGSWGTTLAHMGLGVFVLGACFETAWKTEGVQTLALGQSLNVGGFTLTLRDVRPVPGPNYDAERGYITVRAPNGATSEITPERRFYPAQRQTTSQVAIQAHGVSDLYVVLGEARDVAGAKAWLIRSYWNPWARLIFGGPLLMALGGLVSLSDRRLRIAAGARAARAAVDLVPEPAE